MHKLTAVFKHDTADNHFIKFIRQIQIFYDNLILIATLVVFDPLSDKDQERNLRLFLSPSPL